MKQKNHRHITRRFLTFCRKNCVTYKQKTPPEHNSKTQKEKCFVKSERNGILDCHKGFETGGNSRFTARCAGKIIALMLVLSFMLSLLPLGATEVSAASEGGYTYEVSDGKATITDMDESAAVGDISIPSELGGYPVTAIGKEAFLLLRRPDIGNHPGRCDGDR